MQKRNNALDITKFISAIFVIAIHTNPLADMNYNINFVFKDIICRLAVLFFIICSGYFLGQRFIFLDGRLLKDKNNTKYLCKQMTKLIFGYIGWSVVYLLISIPNWIETGWFSLHVLVDWTISLLWYGSYYHFWYLISMIYALPFLFIVLRKIKISHLYILVLILWTIEIIIDVYYGFFQDFLQEYFVIFDMYRTQIIPLTRVFTRILPLLLLGVIISRDNESVREENKAKNYFICFIFFLICWLIEALILKALGQSEVLYLIFTLPTVYYMFCFILRCNRCLKWSCSSVLGKISGMMYYAHPALIWVITKFVNIDTFLLFIVTVISSVLFGYAYLSVKRVLKSRYFCCNRLKINKEE